MGLRASLFSWLNTSSAMGVVFSVPPLPPSPAGSPPVAQEGVKAGHVACRFPSCGTGGTPRQRPGGCGKWPEHGLRNGHRVQRTVVTPQPFGQPPCSTGGRKSGSRCLPLSLLWNRGGRRVSGRGVAEIGKNTASATATVFSVPPLPPSPSGSPPVAQEGVKAGAVALRGAACQNPGHPSYPRTQGNCPCLSCTPPVYRFPSSWPGPC
jgi:hypothetical protein